LRIKDHRLARSLEKTAIDRNGGGGMIQAVHFTARWHINSNDTRAVIGRSM